MKLNHEDIEKLDACDAIVSDLDGTLYLNNHAIPGAQEFLQFINRSSKKLFYFTNNTSISRRSYLDKIAALGFPSADEMLITAADCADAYLKLKNLHPNIYLVGTKDLILEFEQRGYHCVSDAEAAGTTPQAVILGFDTELTYSKIQTCYDLITRDVPYIATHADILCPVTKNMFKPDIGSFIALFETATSGKRPVVVGKPSPYAVSAIGERAKVPINKIAFIGDRLYTDIRMANNSGMTSVLVLSGETSRDMLLVSKDKPDIIIESIADLTTLLKR